MRLYLLALVALLLGATHASAPAPVSLSESGLLKELLWRAQAGQASAAGGVAAPLDVIVDFLLAGAVPQIVSKGSPSLPLPDFAFHVNTSIGRGISIAGGVEAGGGSLQDMKSLFRKDATVLRRGAGGALLLEVAAGLRVLRVAYQKYSAFFNGPLAAGALQVEVSPVAVQVQLALVPPCTVQLKLIRVAQLGPIRVKVTGLPSSLSGIPKMAENFLAYPSVRQEMESYVIGHVSALITQALKSLSCKK